MRILPALLLILCASIAFADDAAATAPLGAAFVARARTLPNAPSHRFFDRENVALHASNLLLQTGDFLSTRRILQHGGREGDPLARPLVRRGLGGQLAASYALGAGGTLLLAYWLHRMGHHRLERWVPMGVDVVEGLAVASNARVLAQGRLR